MTCLPIAVTVGEPAGIGAEIIVKAWQTLRDETPFFVIGDAVHIEDTATKYGGPVQTITCTSEAINVCSDSLPILDHPFPTRPTPGVLDKTNASAVIEIIERGVSLVHEGEASSICTAPIHKQNLVEGAGFAFPGHTEFLAYLCHADAPVMMLCAPELRVVPVTIHIPLSDISRVLTRELLTEAIRETHQSLVNDFGISYPSISVAGLNPHAGEGGLIGREEIETISPVIAQLRKEGLQLSGPQSADTMFHPDARKTYDAAVCMYHDQALIPLKTIDFYRGVNTTLGLDIVRTSPDHGTGLDIAGKNRANPDSMIAALRLAQSMSRSRNRSI